MNEMTREEMINFAKSLDENHPAYDDIWADILFGGKNPNEVYETVREAYNTGAIKVEEAPKYQEWMSQWELMDGKAE